MKPFDPGLLRDLPAIRGPVGWLGVLGVVSGVAAIAQAVLVAVAVARVVTGTPWGWVLGAVVGLIVLRGLLAAAAEYVARVTGQKVAGIVRLTVLRHWLTHPAEQRPSDDEAVTRAGEGVTTIEPYISRYLPALVTGVVVPVLAVATLLWVDFWSALIVLLTLPLLPVFAALIGQHTAAETERRWAAMELLSGHFLDVVKGLPTLVTYGRARAQVGVVRSVGERHRRATGKTLRTAFMTTTALELLATISVALVAVAVGLRLAYGAMDLQVGLMAILLAPEAYWPIRRVGAEFHNAADGATTLDRLRGSLRTNRPHRGGSPVPQVGPASTATVGLSHVSYAHPGRTRTLADVTLNTPAGPGLTVLTGPSGAGKTTVLELIAGLREPAGGVVRGGDVHLAAQRPVILPGTVRDNLALAGARPDEARVAALDRVGLWPALRDRDGLDTDLGDDGFGLSAGQLARLALARALLSAADLVLLDEPTANVAAAALPALHEAITELARTRRVIVVTHDEDLAGLADQRWRIDPAPHPAPPTTPVRPVTEADPGADAEGARAATPRPGQVAPIVTPDGRRGLILACVLGGLALTAGIALTATSGWLVVQASTQPVILTLLVAIVGVRAFGLARPVLRYAERIVSHDVALEDLASRRADVFARLIPLTPARLGRRSRGQLLTALVRDLDDVVDDQIRVTVPGWSVAIASVIGSGIALFHSPAAAGAVLAGSAVVGMIGWLATRAELTAQHQAVASRGELQHRTTAVAGRMLAVQAASGIRRLRHDTSALLAPVALAQRAHQRAERRLIGVRAGALTAVWLTLAGTAAVVLMLAWQAHSVGSLSAPYAALLALLPMALADVWGEVPDIAGARARARAAASRVSALLDSEPAVADTGERPVPGEQRHGPDLALDRLTARWSTDPLRPPALTGLDLDLPPGARVKLTGANGSGKSTALAVLARHLDPFAGRYLLGTASTTDLQTEHVRALLAVVDDEPHAFAGPLRANLALARPDAADEELVAALGAAHLSDWYATLPHGLDTTIGGLSGGERARLALARAVLSRRPVVLLDEPAAHLDEFTAQTTLRTVLEALMPGTTIVLVSHRRVPGAHFDEVALGGAGSGTGGTQATALAGTSG
ncbi:thiol reductant ABC exporter subunit CydD [Pseudactinotalea sp. Z1739]|uniref:thiol reductant ABC exporter subunit CydD n=1 Tax=Pseudactinotalea sp. Z1739 TaxID=3413028 RepID=UPI003C7A0F90